MTDKILTQSELKKILNYNPETGIFTWKVPNLYRRINIGDKAGCDDWQGYVRIVNKNKKYKAHRLAFLYMLGRFPKDKVDHINHIRDDNRWVNLREATNLDNQRNLSLYKTNTSGVPGVSFSKNKKKWIARIKVNNIDIHIGYYSEFFEAICARKSAERKYGFHPNHGL